MLAYAGCYLTRKAFSVAKNEDERGLGLSVKEMSRIDGAESVALCAGTGLFGTLGDKLGTRVIVLVGMWQSVITAIAMVPFGIGIVDGAVLFGSRIMSVQRLGALAKKRRQFVFPVRARQHLGFWCTNYAFGVSWLPFWPRYAAQEIWLAFAVFCSEAVLFGLDIVYFFQRNRPRIGFLPPIRTVPRRTESALIRGPRPQRNQTAVASCAEVLCNRMVWLLAIVIFLIKADADTCCFTGAALRKRIAWPQGRRRQDSWAGCATSGRSAWDAGGRHYFRCLFKSKRIPDVCHRHFLPRHLHAAFGLFRQRRLRSRYGMFVIWLLIISRIISRRRQVD